MHLLTIQLSFAFFLYYGKNILENMDRCGIHWRVVIDLNQVGVKDLYYIGVLGSLALVMFMINLAIFLLFNFEWISIEFLK